MPPAGLSFAGEWFFIAPYKSYSNAHAAKRRKSQVRKMPQSGAGVRPRRTTPTNAGKCGKRRSFLDRINCRPKNPRSGLVARAGHLPSNLKHIESPNQGPQFPHPSPSP